MKIQRYRSLVQKVQGKLLLNVWDYKGFPIFQSFSPFHHVCYLLFDVISNKEKLKFSILSMNCAIHLHFAAISVLNENTRVFV